MESAIKVTATQGEKKPEGGGEGDEMRTQNRNTDRTASLGSSLYAYLQKSASVYDTTQQEGGREETLCSFKITAETYSVCILLYIFTHTHTNKQGQVRSGRVHVGGVMVYIW